MESKEMIIRIILAIVCVFCIILVWSSFSNLKKTELEFNEKKATLVKENLDLKDRLESIQDIVNKKIETAAVLEKERETVNNNLSALKEMNGKLSRAYNKININYNALMAERETMLKQLEELKKETLSLASKVSDLEKSPLIERIKEAMNNEENENIKKVLEDALHNIELIKSGKSVNLTPIVVESKAAENKPAEEKGEDEGSGAEQNSTAQTAAPASANKTSTPVIVGQGNVVSSDSNNNLIIINLGRKDKMKEGLRCAVLKNDEEIASGEIISVRYNISAVYIDDVKYKNSISEIKEGDKILIKAEG